MSPINLLLNVLWIVLGGFWLALGWCVAALIMALTIVGLPWSRAALTLAVYTLAPFGRTVVPRDQIEGHETIGTSPLGAIGNLIWLLLAGWWLALEHLIVGVAFAITIIGLPFAWAHFKLAGLSLWPVGMVVIASDGRPQPRSWRYPRRGDGSGGGV